MSRIKDLAKDFDPDEWVCSHYMRKEFNSLQDEMEHRAHCYVDSPGYWEMAIDWAFYGGPKPKDYDPISDDEYSAMIATNDVWVQQAGERDIKGNLRWLKKDGSR